MNCFSCIGGKLLVRLLVRKSKKKFASAKAYLLRGTCTLPVARLVLSLLWQKILTCQHLSNASIPLLHRRVHATGVQGLGLGFNCCVL